MKIRWYISGLTVGGLLVLNGCSSLPSVGPDYEKPEVEAPDAWHEAVQDEFKTGEPDLQTWWTIFNDPTLNMLIERASTNNLNLKTAVARIEQAAALRGVSASQWWPELGAGAAASVVRTTQAQTPAGTDRNGELYDAGLSMAWELDLWGRVRRSVESADASLQASVENYRDILVVLYSDIAFNYINVRTLQERIHFAQNNLGAQNETMELTQNRFDSGLVPALDVSQSQLNLSRTKSVIPPLKQDLVEAINRLSVLMGEMPYALYKELEVKKPIPAAAGDLVVGVPADLIRQRPDVRRAERELASQHALIGATKAELYPTLTLPGTLAVQSSGGDLFTGANSYYSFGPQLKWSIFNGKRIRSQVNAEEAATKAALYTYEQALLLALEEVEGQMSAYANETDRVESLIVAAESAQKSVELVTELYTSGLTDFQNVLNMEQALLDQQDQLALSKGMISAYLVGVYRSLGGGWDMSAAGE
ncbi:efflux transporter outer membrane subunit [Pontiellaceae bacterium B12227]|nr:efflux transporter outer membrane subunit [Pontiellaceae bacterium B12227]